MTYHTIIVVGNLGREPEMRYTPSGQPVTSFSIASNRSYVNTSGEKVDETIWFRVTAWGKLAETCNQYLHKGSRVLVEGRLTPDKNGGPRIWMNKDNQAAASFEINASTVRFLSQRGEGGTGEPMMDGIGGDAGGGDDIPF
jgi:single-strand DNA-binding protein